MPISRTQYILKLIIIIKNFQCPCFVLEYSYSALRKNQLHDISLMTILVKLFALGRELIGKNELKIQLQTGATVQDVLDQLGQDYQDFSRLSSFMIAVNMEYSETSHVLQDGDEVAIIPPVSGG